MDNNTISLQELLDCISKLRDDVNALTVAFSYLALSIPREQMQPTLASLLLESRNPQMVPGTTKFFQVAGGITGRKICW